MDRNFKITILRDGSEYDLLLPSGFSLPSTDTNTAFTLESAIKSPFNVGLKVPVEGNEAAFAYANLDAANIGPNGTFRRRSFTARVMNAQGVRFMGTMEIENIAKSEAGDAFDLNFVANIYATQIDGKTLRDVMDEVYELGTDDASIAAQAKTLSEGAWPDVPMAFPVLGAEGRLPMLLNVYDPENQQYFQNSEGTEYALSPQLYLLEVLRRCFSFFGYRTTGKVFDNLFLRKKLIGSIYTLDLYGFKWDAKYQLGEDVTASGFTYAPVWNIALYQNLDSGILVPSATPYRTPFGSDAFYFHLELYFGDIVSSSIFIYTTNQAPGEQPAFVVPTANGYLSIRLERMITTQQDVGVIIEVPAGQTCSIKANSTLRVIPSLLPNGTEPETRPQIEWRTSFNLKNCVPATSIATFLQALKMQYGIAYDVNPMSKTAEVYFLNEQLEAPVEDVLSGEISEARELEVPPAAKLVFKYENDEQETGLDFEYLGEFPTLFGLRGYTEGNMVGLDPDTPIIFDKKRYALIRNLNTYYVNEDGTWTMGKPAYTKWEYGEGEEQNVSIPITLLPMKFIAWQNKWYAVPYIKEQVVKIARDIEIFPKQWPLYIYNYLGFVSSQFGGVYPQASLSEFDADGIEQNVDSMRLGAGVKDVQGTWVKRWLDMWRNQEVMSLRIFWPARFGRVTEFRRKYLINGVKYLMSTVKQNNEDVEAPLEIELVRVKDAIIPQAFWPLRVVHSAVKPSIVLQADWALINFGDGSDADIVPGGVLGGSTRIYENQIERVITIEQTAIVDLRIDVLDIISIQGLPNTLTRIIIKAIPENLNWFDSRLGFSNCRLLDEIIVQSAFYTSGQVDDFLTIVESWNTSGGYVSISIDSGPSPSAVGLAKKSLLEGRGWLIL